MYWCDDETSLEKRLNKGSCIATSAELAAAHGAKNVTGNFVGGQEMSDDYYLNGSIKPAPKLYLVKD